MSRTDHRGSDPRSGPGLIPARPSVLARFHHGRDHGDLRGSSTKKPAAGGPGRVFSAQLSCVAESCNLSLAPPSRGPLQSRAQSYVMARSPLPLNRFTWLALHPCSILDCGSLTDNARSAVMARSHEMPNLRPWLARPRCSIRSPGSLASHALSASVGSLLSSAQSCEMAPLLTDARSRFTARSRSMLDQSRWLAPYLCTIN